MDEDQEKEHIGHRVRRLRKRKGLSQTALGALVGRKQSAIQSLEAGNTKTAPTLYELAVALETTPKYLATGEGLENATYTADLGTSGNPKGTIAQVDAHIGAGWASDARQSVVMLDSGATIVGAEVLDHWRIPDAVLPSRLRSRRERAAFVECVGDSMEPAIADGDIVLIDTTWRTPSPPGIFALWDGFGMALRRVEIVPNRDPPTVRLIPANSDYSSYERTLDEINIIGRYSGRFTVR